MPIEVIHATLGVAFFAVWAGEGRRSRLKIGGGLLAGMVGVSLVLAWIMYVFTR